MVMGQKMEEEISVLGNYIGIQVDMFKNFVASR